MKIPKWLISKWFCYSLGFFFLFLLFLLFLIPGLEGNDFAANVSSEFLGLSITVIFFYIIFEVRENREWKSVEKNVYRKLGTEIYGLFVQIIHICEVWPTGSSGRYLDGPREDFYKTLFVGQLKYLNEQEELIVREDVLAEEGLAAFFRARADYLNSIETKYSRFLKASIFCRG